MDLKDVTVPFVWWTGPPLHRITCVDALHPLPDESISHLMTGSASGHLVLWRRYIPHPNSFESRSTHTVLTSIEKNIQVQLNEMKAAVAGHHFDRFYPVAVVIGRKPSGVFLTAVTGFHFRQTPLFLACYADGLLSVHECKIF